MSSMLAGMLRSGLLLASVSGVAATSQQPAEPIRTGDAQPEGILPQSFAPQSPVVQPLPPSQTVEPLPPNQTVQSIPSNQLVQPLPAYASDPLAGTVNEWRRLQQSDNWPFTDYANFLLAHPGWPGQTGRRAAAETALPSGSYAPALVVQFFTRFPPITGAGNVRFAEALRLSGRPQEAAEQARKAWRRGVLRPSDESALISQFASALTPADHDARMDMLLWQNAIQSAQRELAYTSPTRRPVFEARLAYRTNAPDAADRGALVEAAGRSDLGYIADRANWLTNANQWPAARAYLAQPRGLVSPPANAEKWFEVLLSNARGAQADGQLQLAYDIARQVDDAYPAGTDVSDRPYGERDDYTSLVWLAGTVAFQNLGRPRDAVGLFERYAGGSRTPQTQSKGYYWAGRAAEAAGDRATADGFYARAAGYSDLFYGQLAAERMGQPLRRPPELNAAVADATARAAFNAREVVRAARLLGAMGDWQSQSLFLRQIAQDATSDSDHVLAAELGRSLNRPDLAVMVGRSALENGLNDYTAAGYPSVPVPADQEQYWTIIHAIARQESQFDTHAVSRTGARGLMQLMPGTAREVAGRLGLAYSPDALNRDTSYNIQLGSTYFQRLLGQFGGSYPLAVAAYNAGAGNVNKWLAAYGDPRLPGGDVVRWIEQIPYYETKNYVQRVLENAVVYDLMNPQHARSSGQARLSWYLGKQRPG